MGGGTRVVYNPRGAYSETQSLNAASVQESRGKVRTDGGVDVWRSETDRLKSEGVSCIRYNDIFRNRPSARTVSFIYLELRFPGEVLRGGGFSQCISPRGDQV